MLLSILYVLALFCEDHFEEVMLEGGSGRSLSLKTLFIDFCQSETADCSLMHSSFHTFKTGSQQDLEANPLVFYFLFKSQLEKTHLFNIFINNL